MSPERPYLPDGRLLPDRVKLPGRRPPADVLAATAIDEDRASDRLQRLVEAGIALSSELSAEALLRRVIETAVALTGARYGALGVIDSLGTGLEQFITVGIDEEERASIGSLPRGRGILGALINERQPLRLRALDEDSRSVGFPPGHPPMRSFLGVPIQIRRAAFGNLYLTEKEGGAEFTVQDEEILRVLAAQAAVAIENARLYESSREWSRQLESLNEVSEGLVSELDLAQLFELAAARLRELLDARLTLIELPTPDGSGLTIEAASGENAAHLLGLRLDLSGSKAGRTLARRRAERVDALIDDPEVDQTAPRLVDATSALYVPLLLRDRAVGVIAVYDKRGADPRFSDADMRVAEAFATRAALAVELSERVDRKLLGALLEGQELERKRLARELHDETGQALTSILLGLKTVETSLGKEPVDLIRELVLTALDNVRRLTYELRPPTLDDYGLAAALERLTSIVGDKSGLNVQLSVSIPFGLGPAHETALYRIIQEALANVVKHAGARSVSIVVAGGASVVRTVIEDDGLGFETASPRDGALGLLGMRERVNLLGGRIDVESTPDVGTTIVVELPRVDEN